MKIDQRERVLAREITESANKLNALMREADSIGLTVNVTPTKVQKTNGSDVRQVKVTVVAELSTSSAPARDGGNR